MIIEDLTNKLADCPSISIPIYTMLFPIEPANCIAIFPAHGKPPGHYTSGSGTATGAIDYPDVQVQVRYTDPHNAFAICEAIRLWLDFNPPTGYLLVKTDRSQPDDLSNDADLSMTGGPCYRFSCNFSFIKVRT